jgi:hypothetical protein
LPIKIQRLDAQESNLLELAIDDSIPKEKIRTKLRQIANDKERLNEQLEATKETLTDAAEFIRTNLELLENPYELYRGASDEVRRRLNQAIFSRVFIDHDEIVDHQLEAPLNELHAAQTAYIGGAPTPQAAHPKQGEQARGINRKSKTPGAKETTQATAHPRTSKRPTASPTHRVGFCSRPLLVGLTGFEPATP